MTMPAFPRLRMLRKHWKLAAIAVFSLSIAMALGVVSLSFSNTFLLLAPAGAQPDRLVMISSHSPNESIGLISYPDFEYFREHSHSFTDIAALPNSISVNDYIDDGGVDIKTMSTAVSGNYLSVLGMKPLIGRWLEPADETAQSAVAVMTYGCWKRLGSHPDVIGRKIGGVTIVGVMPKEFTGAFYGLNGDLLVALSDHNFDRAWRTQRDARRLNLLARLKPGVSRREARAEMSALAGQLASAFPAEDKGRTAMVNRATLLPPDALATAELIFGLLLLVALLVLLIACANVANLLLAIAVGRRQEASIKLALGASRGRLIREFLTESAMLCVASAAIGFAIAAAVIRRYSDLSFNFPVFGQFSFGLNLHVDYRVISLTLGLMLIAILATGLAPALYASSPALAQVLGGEIVVGGRRKNVRRNILVIVQVAISTLVLIGMGICQRSLYNLRHIDTGFTARNLAAVQGFAEEHDSADQVKQHYANFRRAVAAIPGVEAVTIATDLPLLGVSSATVQLTAGSEKIPASASTVDGDYFDTFGIRLLSGRAFNEDDRENTTPVIIVNRKMAAKLWPGQDAVGRTFFEGDPVRKAVVIGVVADGKYEDIDEDPKLFMYYAISQQNPRNAYVIARTKGDPRGWLAPLADAARSAGQQIVMQPFTFANWLNLSLITQRIIAACVAALSGLGLLLAIIGLFGAISYSVSERRKELGIRVALGARRTQLLRMILRQTLAIVGTGVAIGLLLGVAATILLRSQFYGISAGEWTVLVPVSAAMLAIATLVAYVSARPWLAVDPMEAVRHA